MRLALPLSLLVVAGLGPARAGGLSLPEPNAAALGRAGAAAAIPDGPSAIYYNPAGLALTRGLSIEAGLSVAYDRTWATPQGGTAYRTAQTVAMPQLFISQRLGDHFAIGLGFYAAPSQALEYPSSYPDRFHVLRSDFSGTELTPTVAGRPFSWLSIGFGLRILFTDIDVTQSIGDARYETQNAVTGSARGLGGTAGVWARLYRDYLTLGIAYKSAIDLDHTGHARITAPGSDTTLAVQDALLSIPVPHMISFSLGSRPTRSTSVQIEARVAFVGDLIGFYATTTASPPVAITSIPLDVHTLVQLRAGAEQHVLRDRLALRLGVGYDLGSSRSDLDPAFPDGDRVLLSAGAGYRRPDLSVDAGYLASFSPGTTGSRGIADPAVYASVRHLVGVSLSVRIENVGPRARY